MTSPTPHIIIKQDGEDREIFMSYGLLNVLATKVQSPEVIPAVSLDAEMREEILKEILAERTKAGKVTKEVEDVNDFEISIDDIEKLLDWAMDHTMGFFIRALQRAEQLTTRNKAAMEQLASSLPGSTA